MRTGCSVASLFAQIDAMCGSRKAISLTLLIGGACIAVASLFFLGFVTIPPRIPTPLSWREIHAGMQRSKILELVGPARTGWYPEKTLEAWWQEEPLWLRKLEVVYRDGRAVVVREYLLWRPSGRVIPERIELLPPGDFM